MFFAFGEFDGVDVVEGRTEGDCLRKKQYLCASIVISNIKKQL